MKSLVTSTTQLPGWVFAVIAVLLIVWKQIYPDLDPSHPQLWDAFVTALTIIISVIGGAKIAIAHMFQQVSNNTRAGRVPPYQN